MGWWTASLLVAKLQFLRRRSALQQAIQELGRLAKTRNVLAFVDDERLRRPVMVGLNRQESIHAMARAIFFGRQRRFGDRGYEAQLNRASALSLAINAIVVCNTRYLAAAAAELKRRGKPAPDYAWQHLSPLLWQHVHFVGTYCFDEPAIAGSFAPLRDDALIATASAELEMGTPKVPCSSALPVNLRQKHNENPILPRPRLPWATGAAPSASRLRSTP